MKVILPIFFLLGCFFAKAQVFTFQCVDSMQLTGINCDICPSTNNLSRSFCGLLIFKNAVPYKWIDQPYTIRLRPGNSIEYIEQIPSISGVQTQDRVTISRSQTGFSTSQGMIDSTVCHCATATPETTLFYASDSIDYAPILRGDTLLIVGRGVATVEFDSLLKKYVVNVDSVSSGSATANNGVSDNEAGGILRLGNRYMASPDAPFTMDRSVNVDGRVLFMGDLSDSSLLVVEGALDRIGISTPIPTRTLDVDGEMRIRDRVTDTPVDVLGSDGDGDVGVLTLSRLSILSGALTAYEGNNGLSDNEGGGVYRLGNRYMNGSDGLFSFDRKINLNAFRLFIGDNTDSTLLHIDGTNDKVGVHTTSPGRTFSVNGEVEIKDLITTTPDRIVGADGNGVLSEITVSTGLSLSGGLLTSTGGTFYQTWQDDNVSATQQPQADFVSTSTIAWTLTNDGPNSETDVSAIVPASGITSTEIADNAVGTTEIAANAVANADFRQGVARSVVGVTGNATANVADIQGTADQVLRVTTAGTALAFGTVATGGIADDAVTYAKIQNVVNDERILGRVSGANGIIEELTQAQAQTFLGLTGVANRFALWTGVNTLASDPAFTFLVDRMTITGTVAGFGAGNALLNINTGAIGSTEFLRISGTITGNLLNTIFNARNVATTDNAILQIISGGSSAGDAMMQYTVSGQMTHTIGIDNSDGDRFKITPNATSPGGNADMGIIVRDNAGTGAVGINKDFPGHPLDGLGRAAFELWQGGAGNAWTFASNVAYGNGAGTAPTGTSIVGHGNSVRLLFSTGTTPTADGDVLILSYPFTFTTTSIVTFSARNSDATQPDFYISAENNAGCTLKVRGTLTASTAYHINFHFWGY